MSWQAVAYVGFTAALAVIFAWIICRTYRPAREKHVEKPKYRMLDEDGGTGFSDDE